jgi:hypothetical protein
MRYEGYLKSWKLLFIGFHTFHRTHFIKHLLICLQINTKVM